MCVKICIDYNPAVREFRVNAQVDNEAPKFFHCADMEKAAAKLDEVANIYRNLNRIVYTCDKPVKFIGGHW